MTTYSIVGMNHQGTEAIVAELKPGTAVTLVREPDNKFDAFAVAVWVAGVHVGYIPKSHNKPLAAKIDADGELTAIMGMDEGGGNVQTGRGKAINAKFVRSPNSGYPMVEVGE